MVILLNEPDLITEYCLALFFATKGKCDKFIYNGDTININSKSLLDKYPSFKSLKSKLPACYRVEWSLVNNELLLTNIYACATATTHLKAINLTSLFTTKNIRIIGTWVTDTLWFPIEKAKTYLGFHKAIYNSELRIVLKNGVIDSKMKFDYRNSSEKLYIYDTDALNKFIYSHINWKILPNVESHKVKVMLNVETGPNGKIQSIKQLYMSNVHIYNDEVLRVVNALPLGVYYKHGKVVTDKTFVEIVFSEANRKQYAQ